MLANGGWSFSRKKTWTSALIIRLKYLNVGKDFSGVHLIDEGKRKIDIRIWIKIQFKSELKVNPVIGKTGTKKW